MSSRPWRVRRPGQLPSWTLDRRTRGIAQTPGIHAVQSWYVKPLRSRKNNQKESRALSQYKDRLSCLRLLNASEAMLKLRTKIDRHRIVTKHNDKNNYINDNKNKGACEYILRCTVHGTTKKNILGENMYSYICTYHTLPNTLTLEVV